VFVRIKDINKIRISSPGNKFPLISEYSSLITSSAVSQRRELFTTWLLCTTNLISNGSN